MKLLRFMGINVKKLFTIAASVVLAGCVAQSQMYINSNRHTVRCASSGFGVSGMIASGINMGNCSSDYANLGYLPLEEAGVTGINFLKANDPLVINKVVAGSPAAKANIVAGDTIISINGEKPANAGEAIKMLFGRAGSTITLVLKGTPAPRTVDLTLVPYPSLYGAQQAAPK